MLVETSPQLAVEELQDTDVLERLRPEWSSLWARCPTSTPFQSPEWLIPWWRHIGEGQLWGLAFRSAGQLVGLVPLYIYQRPGASIRELFLLGIGTTDYLDVLLDPEHEQACFEALVTHLGQQSHRWDVADFQQLRPDSPLLRLSAPEGWADRVNPHSACPVLPLPAKVEALEETVPKRMLHNLRYYSRRAERLGQIKFESATLDNLDELFEALLRLHRVRWSTRGEPGVLSSPNVQQAHRESLPGLLRIGALRLYALRLDQRIVACFYGFADRDRPGKRVYYYLGGFDPELEELSLGSLLIGHAIREAIEVGAEAFDFLRGAERYKYLWGAQDCDTYRRNLWHSSAPS